MTVIVFDHDSDELIFLYEILGWPLDDRRDMTVEEIEQRIAEIEAQYGVEVSA